MSAERQVKKAAKKSPGTNKKETNRRSILLVDDHPLFRSGMKQLFDTQADLKVTGEAETSGEALNGVRTNRYNLAVVDIGLRGGANGIELTKMFKAEHPAMPVLIVSMHDELLYAERALRAGARGYVMKREALDSILHAVRSVLNGEIYISPTMTKRMLFDHIQGGGEARNAVERLTDRELEVFQLIGEGNDMHQIAEQLHLSKKTAEAHRANIKEKLGGQQRARSGALRDAMGGAGTLGAARLRRRVNIRTPCASVLGSRRLNSPTRRECHDRNYLCP